MEYARWAPQYARIQRAFGFPFEREERAARRLTELLPASQSPVALAEVARRLSSKEVVIAGLAPRLGAPPVWRLPTDRGRVALVAADGATARCLDAGLVPDVIVTDLDGPVASEVAANARGALVIVHAHGDNLAALERWVPEFAGDVYGSWAGPPTPELLDVGGFTDGDRSVFLAEHVGASEILLWAFDFAAVEDEESVGRERKLAKLSWANELIDWLAGGSRIPIYRWSPDGSRSRYGIAGTGPSTQ